MRLISEEEHNEFWEYTSPWHMDWFPYDLKGHYITIGFSPGAIPYLKGSIFLSSSDKDNYVIRLFILWEEGIHQIGYIDKYNHELYIFSSKDIDLEPTIPLDTNRREELVGGVLAPSEWDRLITDKVDVFEL